LGFLMPTSCPSTPDKTLDNEWRNPMKNIILAAFAVLSLTVAIAPTASAATFHNGSSVAGDAQATRMEQTGSLAQ
jgi:hypothetical protein